MRTSDGYRFSLQFKNLSDAHRQIGEFLESLKNKKSEVVVAALIEYLQSHPDILNKDNPIRVITFGFSEDSLTAKLEELIKKHIGNEYSSDKKHENDSIPILKDTQAMDTLLEGLKIFN